MAAELVEAIADMREDDALAYVKKALDGDVDPLSILEDCRQAMSIVGKRFEQAEYFVPELIFAGEILRQISDLVKPRLAGASGQQKAGRVVIGTVEGDIHDIGKDIVSFMLDVNGFDVRDLGVDVPASKFIDAVRETNAQVLGLSGFLTLAYDPMKNTVEALKEAGLRDKVKVMIGGGQMDEHIREYTGADAYGKDAMAAVELAKTWVKKG